jgi:hypothetical protein
MLSTALLNYSNVLVLVSGNISSVGIENGQVPSQILFYLNSFDQMMSLGLVVFGFHILVLGYLVFKSGFLPKTFGVLLVLAFFGYMIPKLIDLLLPNYEYFTTIIEMIFFLPMVIGEVGLGIWLIIKDSSIEKLPHFINGNNMN